MLFTGVGVGFLSHETSFYLMVPYLCTPINSTWYPAFLGENGVFSLRLTTAAIGCCYVGTRIVLHSRHGSRRQGTCRHACFRVRAEPWGLRYI